MAGDQLDHIAENVQALTDWFVRRRRWLTPIIVAVTMNGSEVAWSKPAIAAWWRPIWEL